MSAHTSTLLQLASQVQGHATAGERQITKAEDHYRSAGIYLIEARTRIAAGETGEFQTFSAFCSGGTGLGKTRAYEMISIAEGTKSLEEIREQSRATSRRYDERQQAGRPSSDGQGSNPPEPNENPKETSETPRKPGRPPKEATPEQALIQQITKRLRSMNLEQLRNVNQITKDIANV